MDKNITVQLIRGNLCLDYNEPIVQEVGKDPLAEIHTSSAFSLFNSRHCLKNVALLTLQIIHGCSYTAAMHQKDLLG